MGCSSSKQPVYIASCDDNIGDRITVEGFCSVSGPGGTQARRDGCNRLGMAGEYGEENMGGGCNFPSGTNDYCTSSGGVVGNGLTCKRLDFKGDVGWCCTTGLGPTGGTRPCFVDNDQKNGTCPPNARSSSSEGCMNYYLPSANSNGFCNPDSFNAFVERWDPNSEKGYCYRALITNAGEGNTTNVRSLGQLLMEGYFSRYQLTEKGQAGYNDFQETVLDICKRTPGACGNYLKNNLCRDYTRENVLDLPARQSFCGCHLQNNQYETFLNEKAGVRRECDTVCIAERTIKPTDSAGNLQVCQSTICAIDNVTIDLINSQAGDISFSQVCGSNCTGACSCIFKDINISGQNSKIGDIDFGQSCNTKTCYVTSEEDGGLVEVDCEKFEEEAEERAQDPGERDNDVEGSGSVAIIFVIMGIIIFILLIVLMIMLFTRD